MNRSIRALAMILLGLFGLLGLAASYQQVIAATGYRTDLRNVRAIEDRATRERGSILTADGVVVARSVETVPESGRWSREYPAGRSYAHVVGYSSPLFGDTGIEHLRAEELKATDDGSLRAAIERLLGADLRPHDIVLSIRHDLQQTAADALDGRPGAVVALDPSTGAILALVSEPTFDPAVLIDPSSTAAGDALAADLTRPLVARATGEVYPPGSTFKVITAAAALRQSLATPGTLLPDAEEFLPPGSSTPIRNAGEGLCNDGRRMTLERALAVSCNTAFASLGVAVGGSALVDAARAFGFDSAPPFELPVVPSRVPDPEDLDADPAALAQNALGERDIRATPFQMALVAAAVANNGVTMRPYLVAQVLTADGDIATAAEPEEWRNALGEGVASDLAGMMQQVVATGTGRRASVPGLTVAGKTGTAQAGEGPPHVWFIGFATEEDGDSIAIAVMVESGEHLDEDATGGRIAAPIARAVMEAWSVRTN